MNRARSIWVGITVGLVVLTYRLYQASSYVPKQALDGIERPIYTCGLGAMMCLFAAAFMACVALVALSIAVTRKRTEQVLAPVPLMTAR